MTGGQSDTDDRFASWDRWPARLLLAALAALLLAAALVPIKAADQPYSTAGFVANVTGARVEGAERPRDHDLALYDTVILRIAKGENYYVVAAQEHRRSDYPVRPALPCGCRRWPTCACCWARSGRWWWRSA